MNIKSLILPGIATGACLVELCFPSDVRAQSVCTLHTLQSPYGVQATGTIISEPLPPGPFGKVGWVSFDGYGNFNGNDTVSFNGKVISREFSGSYAVEPNCKISLSFTDNLGNSGKLEGVIVNQGRKILLIQVVPDGRVITSTAEKV
ncbi:MAG: hypothetical protein NHB32_15680 [Fischerella sp. CENA71]|nr:hypothetical protein [Fischerella sp. CENA71]